MQTFFVTIGLLILGCSNKSLNQKANYSSLAEAGKCTPSSCSIGTRCSSEGYCVPIIKHP